MADNYLENKMAEHMARRSAPARAAAPAPRPGTLCLNLPPRRVLIAGPCAPVALACAAAFAAHASRVALLSAPEALPGVRCYPPSVSPAAAIAALIHDWHEIDILILAGPDPAVEQALADARAAIPAPLRLPRPSTITITPSPTPSAIAPSAARAALLLSAVPPHTATITI